MSNRAQSKPANALPLGNWLRQLRHARHLPIRTVAAAEMDTAHLSKIELDQRLPTEAQTTTLARFLRIPPEDFQAKRIADKFWYEHRDAPAAHRAIDLIKEKADARADCDNG